MRPSHIQPRLQVRWTQPASAGHGSWLPARAPDDARVMASAGERSESRLPGPQKSRPEGLAPNFTVTSSAAQCCLQLRAASLLRESKRDFHRFSAVDG